MRGSAALCLSLAVLSPASFSPAQASAALEIGAALIRARCNPLDDPDAIVAELMEAALVHPRSAASELLLREAQGHLPLVRDPGSALEALRAFLAASPHGLGAQAARELEVICLSMIDPVAALELEPYSDLAGEVLAIGPFGDSGDHYTGVPFPPELRFPDAETSLAGRFGPVRTRVVRRKPGSASLVLTDPADRRRGCQYALHRIDVEAAVSAWLELTCEGSFQVFVNGTELGRVNRNRRPSPNRWFFPVALLQGRNHVLVKTTTADGDRVALRYVDGAGRTLSGVREVPAEEPVGPWATGPQPPVGGELADGVAALGSGLRGLGGEDLATLRVAVALAALQAGDLNRGLVVLRQLEAEPPDDPATRLALAVAVRSANPLPAEIRGGWARSLVESVGDRLSDHHRLDMERVNLLEEEDRGEDAVRLLQAAVDAGRAGPETFLQLQRILSRLSFDTEVQRVAESWIEAVPADPRPVLLRAAFRSQGGDKRGALQLLQKAIRRQPGSAPLQRRIADLAMDLADMELAREMLDAMHSREPDSLEALQDRATLLRRSGRRDEAVQAYRAVAEHPDADAEQIGAAADRIYELGDQAAAVTAYRRALEVDPSRHALRRMLARLEGTEEFPAIARFRRDGDQAIAGFEAGEREGRAPSTMVLDQLIVQIWPDGSSVAETHQIRRINDRRGVERFQNADRAATASEVILVRTVATDGVSYVPNRVEGSFSMPRLEPGAFVEWVVRDYGEAPGAAPWRGPLFLFQSDEEPYLSSELVVILPPDAPGTFRVRGFSGEPERIALEDGSEAHVFSRSDMPRLQAERLLPPIQDLVPVVTFGEDGDLAATARLAHALALRRSYVTPYVTATAEELTGDLTGDRERLAAIHRFVHQEIPDGGGTADPTAILLRGQGPRFFLEAALLSAAGVPIQHARVAAVRGELRDLPEPLFRGEELHEVSALLVRPRDGEPVWLFADSPRFSPLGEIPSQRLGAGALLLEEGSGRLVRLPDGDRIGSQGYLLHGTVQIRPEGSAGIEADLVLRGTLGRSAAEQVRNLEDNLGEVAARQLITGVLEGWTLRGVDFVDLTEPGQPLHVRGQLERPRALRPAGDTWLFPLPLLPGSYMAALGDRGGREHPLSLTESTSATWELTIDPGDGFRFSEVPASLQVQQDILDYSLTFRMDGESLIVRREIYQRPGRIPARRFEEWRALLGRLDQAEALNLRLVRR